MQLEIKEDQDTLREGCRSKGCFRASRSGDDRIVIGSNGGRKDDDPEDGVRAEKAVER